jgi:hypothetical protein
MILTCSSVVLIRSLGSIYPSMTNPMSSPFVMIMLVEATLVLNFIGLPYFVSVAKRLGVFLGRI